MPLPTGSCKTPGCDNDKVKLRPNPFTNVQQCEDCRASPEHGIIGITDIKQKHKLKEADLKGLRTTTEPKPAFLGGPDKRWYWIKEVVKRAEEVKSKVAIEKQRKEAEKQKKAAQKEKAKELKEKEKELKKKEKELKAEEKKLKKQKAEVGTTGKRKRAAEDSDGDDDVEEGGDEGPKAKSKAKVTKARHASNKKAKVVEISDDEGAN